jgi:nucleoside-diphosphate-sugar epimerase
MINILITGSSGFVGKNLHNYLKNSQNKLFLFSRSKGLEYNTINEDFLNINNIDVIIHLAGKAHDLKKHNIDNDYHKANTELTKNIYNSFINSNSKIFIYLSSVKAVKDYLNKPLTEDILPTPITPYGKSKLAAENYISSKELSTGKKLFILRPCMIYGPGNKGNLNLLYNFILKFKFWPLGSFDNKRSFCSIDNLCFIINKLINKTDIESGIYNISDDEPLSTNELIKLIAKANNKKYYIISINKKLIYFFAKIGQFFNLSLNTDNLNKLTENYIVNNEKIKLAIKEKLPFNSKNGLLKTFTKFKN